MKLFALLVVICACSTCLVGASTTDPTLELDDQNFEGVISNSSLALVEFYATWCGYCREFAPVYEEAASRIKKLNDSVIVAKINAPENEDSAEKYDIEALPTIKWFVDGQVKHEYNGSPDIDSFMNWITKILTTPAKEVKSEQDVEKSRESPLSIIGVFDEYKGDAYDTFLEFALMSDDIEYYKTLDKDLMQVESSPALVFSKNLSGHPFEVIRKSLVGDGDALAEDIYYFMDKHKHPDFFTFDESNIKDMMQVMDRVDRDYHVHLVVPKALLSDKAFLEFAREAGRSIRSKAALILAVDDKESPLNSAFKIEKTNDVQILAAHTSTIRKFKLAPVSAKSLEAEKIVDFVENISSGANDYRVYASAPIPEDDKDSGITILVRDTLDKVTKDPTKDVLVHVYQPEDDESMEFTEQYQNLATALKNISSVVLAKYDCSVNEHEAIDFPFDELPQLVLFPANKESKPIFMDTYEGLDVSTVGKFIHENAAIKFELPDLEPYKVEIAEDEEEEQEEEVGTSHDEL